MPENLRGSLRSKTKKKHPTFARCFRFFIVSFLCCHFVFQNHLMISYSFHPMISNQNFRFDSSNRYLFLCLFRYLNRHQNH